MVRFFKEGAEVIENGLVHRKEGPAVFDWERKNANKVIFVEYGLIHRTEGPAECSESEEEQEDDQYYLLNKEYGPVSERDSLPK